VLAGYRVAMRRHLPVEQETKMFRLVL
jgi:hypothetical protein